MDDERLTTISLTKAAHPTPSSPVHDFLPLSKDKTVQFSLYGSPIHSLLQFMLKTTEYSDLKSSLQSLPPSHNLRKWLCPTISRPWSTLVSLIYTYISSFQSGFGPLWGFKSRHFFMSSIGLLILVFEYFPLHQTLMCKVIFEFLFCIISSPSSDPT